MHQTDPHKTPPHATAAHSASGPVRLGYDSRIVPLPDDESSTHGPRLPLRVLVLQTLAGLPGLILTASLLILIPSLLYATIDPWFGGNSTLEALQNAGRATAWAVPALVLVLILRRRRNRNRRRPSPPVTGSV
jgi:hypothetical protein